MSEIFFTSDTHLGHDKDFIWQARGFSCVEEMNEAIVENWNSIVKPDDIVYHCGDIILGNKEHSIEYVKRLNGQIYMIWGNHDVDTCKNLLMAEANIIGGWYAQMIKYKKLNIYLSHYPTLVDNYDDKKFNRHIINLHGHTHQKNNWYQLDNPFIYHVGVDSHNCTPVHIETVITDIKNAWELITKE